MSRDRMGTYTDRFDALRWFLAEAPDSWERIELTFEQVEILVDATGYKFSTHCAPPPELDLGIDFDPKMASGFRVSHIDPTARIIVFERVR